MSKYLIVPALLTACSGDSKPVTPLPAEEPAPTAAVPAGPRPNLVLITMDTTRVDHLGIYGREGAITPTIDGLAKEGLRFERAWSVLPLTTPAHSSMHSGLYPTRHGIHNNGDAVLSDDVTTLAELLKERGYATAASVSAFVTTRIWNLDQGFDAYYDEVKMDAERKSRGRWARERRAGEVVDDLIEWTGKVPAGQPYFVWAHFYDPHDPYDPPKEFAEKLPGRPYDGEIAYMDAQIARLKAAIDAKNGNDGTAWILVADHGEAINREHGEVTHGMYVYNSTMRIPFIVRPPKPLAAEVVEKELSVSNVDVMPTALGLLGAEIPKELDGVDLSGLTRGVPAQRSAVYMEAESAKQRFGFAPEHAIAEGPLKLFDTPNPRLFDIATDPNEEKNLIKDRAADAERLRKVNQEVQAKRIDVAGGATSPEVVAQLQALGYISGSASPVPEGTVLLDAKDQSALIEKLEQARRLSSRGKPAEAVAIYQEVLAAHPQIAEARLAMARALQMQRKPKEAEEVLRGALELEPQSTVIRASLANALSSQRRNDEALALYQTILDQVPADDVARNGMLQCLLDLERFDEAKTKATSWLAENPTEMVYESVLGIVEFRQSNFAAAENHLLKSLSDDMPRRRIYHTLAMLASRTNNTSKVEEYLRAESAWFPQDLRVRTELANVLMKREAWDEAAAEYEFVAQVQQKNPQAYRQWAQAIFNTGDYPGTRKILDNALKLAPGDPFILLLNANLLQKEGKEEEAKATFDRAKKAKAAMDAQKQAEKVEADPGAAPIGVPALEEGTYEEMQQYGIPQ